MKKLGLILFFGLFLCDIQASESKKDLPKEGKVLRIGGEFRIKSIEKLAEKDFRVVFESLTKTAKANQLVLRTNHIHFGLSEGEQIRLSAEVVGEGSDVLNVTQVLLFIPQETYGMTPVWILSNQFPTGELRGAKWLEMHAPQADYQVM
jgi:hypothetical protein